MARPPAFDDDRSFVDNLREQLLRRLPSTPHRQALLLAAGLGSFLAAYLTTLAASLGAVGWLGFRLLSGNFSILESIGLVVATAVAALLSLLLAKGLFRRSSFDHNECVELTRDAEPQFFAFLDDLCDRTDAPAPDRVFACPQVNAGVFVRSSLLNLIRPSERHLLIGLGMVEALNRTELEAVLAHEFGHFSQRSIALHDYTRVLTGIIDEIIHGRDHIDALFERWASSPVPDLGVPTVVASATDAVRHGFAALRRQLESLESSVSRRMELQADRVAVDATGSDAILHALLRTDWADRCHSQTLYDLEAATAHDIRTEDLFYHQSRLSETMRRRLDEPDRGKPPRLPDDPDCYVPIFTDDDPDVPRADVWDSHPSHRVREQHARRPYRRSQFDERSAWTLFADPAGLRRAVTDRVYDRRWDDQTSRRSPREVQAFLDGEHAEILLTDDDRTVYGHRFIEPGRLDDAIAEARDTDWSTDEFRDRLDRLTGDEYREAARRMKRNIAPESGPAHKPAASPARPLRQPAGPDPAADRSEQAPSPNEDRQWLADWDRRLLVAMLQTAERLGEESFDTLVARYEFHLHLQDVIRWLREHAPMVDSAVGAVQQESTADDDQLEASILETLRALYDSFETGLEGAPEVPPLHGLPPQTPVAELVLDEPLVDDAPLESGRLDPEWLTEFAEQYHRALDRLGHLRWKSLGALLLYQRELQSELEETREYRE